MGPNLNKLCKPDLHNYLGILSGIDKLHKPCLHNYCSAFGRDNASEI